MNILLIALYYVLGYLLGMAIAETINRYIGGRLFSHV